MHIENLLCLKLLKPDSLYILDMTMTKSIKIEVDLLLFSQGFSYRFLSIYYNLFYSEKLRSQLSSNLKWEFLVRRWGGGGGGGEGGQKFIQMALKSHYQDGHHDNPRLTFTYFIARSNLFSNGFKWE